MILGMASLWDSLHTILDLWKMINTYYVYIYIFVGKISMVTKFLCCWSELFRRSSKKIEFSVGSTFSHKFDIAVAFIVVDWESLKPLHLIHSFLFFSFYLFTLFLSLFLAMIFCTVGWVSIHGAYSNWVSVKTIWCEIIIDKSQLLRKWEPTRIFVHNHWRHFLIVFTFLSLIYRDLEYIILAWKLNSVVLWSLITTILFNTNSM